MTDALYKFIIFLDFSVDPFVINTLLHPEDLTQHV